MNYSDILTLFALFGIVVCAAIADKADLRVETTFMPENCNKRTYSGDKVVINFQGFIDETSSAGTPGQKFADTYESGKSQSFILGKNTVIRGWEKGLLDMCVGEKRTLIVPPEFGYGHKGSSADKLPVPPDATLRYNVEMLMFKDIHQGRNHFKEMDENYDGKITRKEFEAWYANKRPPEKAPKGKFEIEDKNKDGSISWVEFSGPKGKRVYKKGPKDL